MLFYVRAYCKGRTVDRVGHNFNLGNSTCTELAELAEADNVVFKVANQVSNTLACPIHSHPGHRSHSGHRDQTKPGTWATKPESVRDKGAFSCCRLNSFSRISRSHGALGKRSFTVVIESSVEELYHPAHSLWVIIFEVNDRSNTFLKGVRNKSSHLLIWTAYLEVAFDHCCKGLGLNSNNTLVDMKCSRFAFDL